MTFNGYRKFYGKDDWHFGNKMEFLISVEFQHKKNRTEIFELHTPMQELFLGDEPGHKSHDEYQINPADGSLYT